TYQWQGDDAVLLEGLKGVDVSVETAQGSLTHSIPFTRACKECHESSPSAVLGFQPQQLLGDASSGAADSELERAALAGTLEAAVEVEDELADFSGLTRDVLGYFRGNCVHCHNGTVGVSSSYDLSPAVALDTIVDQPTQSSASAVGTRVVPGSPEDSILFLAVSGETDNEEVKAMPPVGVQLPDPYGVELLREWI